MGFFSGKDKQAKIEPMVCRFLHGDTIEEQLVAAREILQTFGENQISTEINPKESFSPYRR